ncbi:prostatic acid phosphatase [Protobothrops mucrosquamatus]|uniref:prostatic acid phosphatase n=1 Tax=Protobothrops mucrosquamatus TaxID=103944 RepID=UPI00077591CB|nr:prostatic acid phosphatase [Protobothrops mucrosquamatus]
MEGTSLARSSKNLHFLLLAFIVSLLQSTLGRELKFVVIIFRHGDRSPIENYPNGLHNESEWPQGFGQLTKIGMQQQYELGQYIKKRYSDFLSASYKREEILIQSTEIDRTIMSAQANLAGLFPPTDDQIWNPELLWQPVPVHVVPKATSPKLRYPIFQCPRYIELLKKTVASDEFQEKIKPYEEFIKTMAYYSGYNASVLKNPMNFKIWHVQDTLFCESIHNYTLPEWATEDVMTKLTEVTELSLSSLFGIYKRKEKARLQGGLLVKDILQKFSEAQFPQKRKMVVYSAHDTTLGALQMALNIYNYKLPPYASCQIFEQYEEENGVHTIEMYFRNDTSKEPYPITLPGCSCACPLQQFAKLVSPILVDNWEKECEKIDIDEGKIPQPADDPEKMQSLKATAEIMRLEFPESAIPERRTEDKPKQERKKRTWHQLLGTVRKAKVSS